MDKIEIKELTKAQLAFLDLCKKIGWGKIEVTIKDGQPVMVKVIEQNFKMD